MSENPIAKICEDVAELKLAKDLAQHYSITEATVVGAFAAAMPKDKSGHRNFTKAELISCMLVAKDHGLNPLTKEIFFMRSRSGDIQPIVSIDGWIRKCLEHPQYDGMEYETIRDDKRKIIEGKCTIYRKDKTHPTVVTEDFEECARAGGPAWNTSPSRMMRNRTISQGARLAFGFAGIMLPDEFDDWQRSMKDVTPTRPTVEDLPDIPDEPILVEDVDQSMPDDEGYEGFLAMLRSHLETAEDIDDAWADHSDTIDSLPQAIEAKAVAIYEEFARGTQ